MRKRCLAWGILCVMLLVCLTGCGGETAQVDVAKLATELKDTIEYQDQLDTIDESVIPLLYPSKVELVKGIVYVSSGATAEEIAVFECASEADAQEMKAAAQKRVEQQITSFQNYVPEELAKLKTAVIMQKGVYVALSISDNPIDAQNIIHNHFNA